MTDPQSLTAETQTFESHKDELLQQSEGKFVLITGTNIVGTYDTKLDAVAAGHQHVDCGPFLVKRILRDEKPVRILLAGKARCQ